MITEKPLYEGERIFKGSGGVSSHTRPYHLYLLKPEGVESVTFDGRRFVGFSEELLDPRDGGGLSKARLILDLLMKNPEKAFFSVEVVEALKGRGVLVRDVIANVKRYERHGLLYVRGYNTDEGQAPFRSARLPFSGFDVFH